MLDNSSLQFFESILKDQLNELHIEKERARDKAKYYYHKCDYINKDDSSVQNSFKLLNYYRQYERDLTEEIKRKEKIQKSIRKILRNGFNK
jgi:hypothetical protein